MKKPEQNEVLIQELYNKIVELKQRLDKLEQEVSAVSDKRISLSFRLAKLEAEVKGLKKS